MGMSWQAYVDTNLVGTGMVTSAGIYDLTGNPWAYSAGFAAQVSEVAKVAAAMQADATTLAGTGALVAGVKYMFVRGSGDEVYVKKGNTCILVGYHDDKIQGGACCTAVGKLQDFLKEN